MSFQKEISSYTASQLASHLNQLAMKHNKIGVESPIVTVKGTKEVSQKGCYRSTLVSYDLQAILNPGVSGSVYFAGSETHEIKANLSFQLSVWNINPDLEWNQKLASIRKRIKFLVKPGDKVKRSQVLFQEDMVGIGIYLNAAMYTKGEGDFYFEVDSLPPITSKDIREDQERGNSIQLTIRIKGKHVTTNCNNQKVAGEAAKACFVPNPKSKNLEDLKTLGGFVLFESSTSHDKTVATILDKSAVRIPHVLVSKNAESTKGNQISKQLYAGTKFCMTGEQTVMQVRQVEKVVGDVSYPSDEQVDEINFFIDSAVRTVTGVRYFRDEFKTILQEQYSDNPNVSWEGNYMFVTGEAMFGMHHTTTELALTEECRSSGGKIFWEAIQAIHNINNTLGWILYATGFKNRQLRDILLKVSSHELPVKKVVWDGEYVFNIESTLTIDSILKSVPKNLCITHGMGNDVWVSTELGFALGLTPEGGTNLVARCIIDLVKQFTVPVGDRDANWFTTKDNLLNIYHSVVKSQVVGEGTNSKNKQLKDSTKTNNLVYTMKVRGIEAPWVKEGCVYLASNDIWASLLQEHNIMQWRNPNPSYKTSLVKIVGPATEECPNPDIILPVQVVAKGTLTIPAIDWYGAGGNGDDDGDLVNFFSIDDLTEWALKPHNESAIKSIPQLHELIYVEE